MYASHEIGQDEHLRWIEKLKTDTHQFVFVVLVDGIVSGGGSINSVDRTNGTAEWGFYLAENIRGGLGTVLDFSLLEFAFDTLGLQKLNADVLETNEGGLRIHKRLGFVDEGLRRENVERDGQRIGVFLLGITKSEWMQKRRSIQEKYKSAFEKFDLSIQHRSIQP